MASHAGFGGGNASKSTLFNGGMTVATVDTHTFYVVLMAEGDGLIHRNTYFAHIIQAIDIEEDPKEGAGDNERYKDACF